MTTKLERMAKVLNIQPFEEFWKENPQLSLSKAQEMWRDFVLEHSFRVRTN